MTEYYLNILSEIEKNYSIMKNMRPLPQDGIEYFKNCYGA